MKLFALLLLALATLCWLEQQVESAYQSSGWRPQGHSFNPCYLPPAKTTATTTTKMKTTKQHREPMTSTSPRSREPTTTLRNNEDDNDLTSDDFNDEQQSPALAVANSFAFNRPIYVYNAYPYRFPSNTYLLRG